MGGDQQRSADQMVIKLLHQIAGRSSPLQHAAASSRLDLKQLRSPASLRPTTRFSTNCHSPSSFAATVALCGSEVSVRLQINCKLVVRAWSIVAEESVPALAAVPLFALFAGCDVTTVQVGDSRHAFARSV